MNEQSQQPPWERDTSGDPIISTPPDLNPPPATDSAPLDEAPPGRLSRVEALDLLGRMKATLVVGSVVALGVFLGLAATHATGVTARAAESGGANSQGVSPTHPSDDGGFFNSGFGIGPPGSHGPASGTSVS